MAIDQQTINLLGCLDAEAIIEILGAVTSVVQMGEIGPSERARIATFMVRFGCSMVESVGYHATAAMVHPELGMALTYSTPIHGDGDNR